MDLYIRDCAVSLYCTGYAVQVQFFIQNQRIHLWVSEAKGEISKITTFVFTLLFKFYDCHMHMFIGFPVIYCLFL